MASFGAKQEWEQYYVVFDFDSYLNPKSGSTTLATEDISSIATCTAVDQYDNHAATASILDSTKFTYTASKAYIWVQNGTSGREYKITCKIHGDKGSKYEYDAVLPILDK